MVGPNPQYPTQTTATSIFGSTAYTWYEGDGMLHATYFDKADNGKWRISYKNKYVVSETFQMEKERNKASFIPAVDGQPHGILAAFVFNMVTILINGLLYLGWGLLTIFFYKLAKLQFF